MKAHMLALIGTLTLQGLALGVSLPAEFETVSDDMDPLFAFFGGVGGILIEQSAHTVYQGQSQEVTVLWQPDPVFNSAGAIVGDTLISGSELSVPSAPSVFSITVETPADIVYSLQIVLGEDDDNDFGVDVLGDDDEWTSPRVLLTPGVEVYNFLLADFIDTNDAGDGIQSFATTGAVSLRVAFESRSSYPGGMAQSPATYFVDHIGFFAEPQTLGTSLTADLNGDGCVDSADLAELLAAWGNSTADLDGDGVTASSDLAILLAAWTGPGCA